MELPRFDGQWSSNKTSFKFGRTEIFYSRVTTMCIVKPFNIFKNRQPGLCPCRIGVMMAQLCFNVAKKLSTTALSQQLPTRLIEARMPC